MLLGKVLAGVLDGAFWAPLDWKVDQQVPLQAEFSKLSVSTTLLPPLLDWVWPAAQVTVTPTGRVLIDTIGRNRVGTVEARVTEEVPPRDV